MNLDICQKIVNKFNLLGYTIKNIKVDISIHNSSVVNTFINFYREIINQDISDEEKQEFLKLIVKCKNHINLVRLKKHFDFTIIDNDIKDLFNQNKNNIYKKIKVDNNIVIYINKTKYNLSIFLKDKIIDNNIMDKIEAAINKIIFTDAVPLSLLERRRIYQLERKLSKDLSLDYEDIEVQREERLCNNKEILLYFYIKIRDKQLCVDIDDINIFFYYDDIIIILKECIKEIDKIFKNHYVFYDILTRLKKSIDINIENIYNL